MFRRRTDGKLETLRAVPAFASFPDEALGELATLADLVSVPEGTVLVREGGRGTEVFLIVEGAVRITHGDEEVATLTSGDFVGEMALLDRRPRSATAITMSDTRLLVFDPRAFDRMVESNRLLTGQLLSQITGRLRAADEARAGKG
jgi:CRP/FNR family transcriptional regulator, cyclic AMP receptor protein